MKLEKINMKLEVCMEEIMRLSKRVDSILEQAELEEDFNSKMFRIEQAIKTADLVSQLDSEYKKLLLKKVKKERNKLLKSIFKSLFKKES